MLNINNIETELISLGRNCHSSGVLIFFNIIYGMLIVLRKYY